MKPDTPGRSKLKTRLGQAIVSWPWDKISSRKSQANNHFT
jgi:hypothetical protein